MIIICTVHLSEPEEMSSERTFLDTAFMQALLSSCDQYHSLAINVFPRIRAAQEIWLTEAVLIEVGNALSVSNRAAASQFIQQSYSIADTKNVDIDDIFFAEGVRCVRHVQTRLGD